MAARPNWAYFKGGPMDGIRRIIHPNLRLEEFVETIDSASPGMVTPLVYRLTAEVHIADNVWKSRSRVAVFVTVLPDVAKPKPRFGALLAHTGPEGPLSEER